MGWFSRIRDQIGNRKSKYVTPGLDDKSEPEEPLTDDAEQSLRRSQTRDRLRGEGIPVSPDLPNSPPESALAMRSSEDVANRLLAFTLVAMKADGMDHGVMLEIVRERDARQFFTAEEEAFIDNPAPSDADRDHFLRFYETAWTLIWALRLVREPLSTPRETCNPEEVVAIVRDTPNLAANTMRRPCRMLDKLDLYLCYDAAARSAVSEGRKPPSHLHPIVACERYRALAWIAGEDFAEPVTAKAA